MAAGLTDVTRTGCPAGLRMGAGLTDVTATERTDLSTMSGDTHIWSDTTGATAMAKTIKEEKQNR